MSTNYLKIPYTHKNKLCNIINNERPSQMLKNQSTYKAPNLIEYGRHITKKNIQDYKFKYKVNENKISSLEFEEISLFSNYIVGVNIAHVAYLRHKISYLPPELWLYIGSFMKLYNNNLISGVVIENRSNFYLEYNMSKVFCNNYNSLQNQYIIKNFYGIKT
jgi:hypothetical protein